MKTASVFTEISRLARNLELSSEAEQAQSALAYQHFGLVL